MVAALIKFSQGSVVGGDGRALITTTSGGSVTAANADDTGVVAWFWELLSSPPPSEIGAGTTSSSPTATLPQPDVPGSYRVRLTVRDAAGNTDRDIRCYGVPFANGIICPPYQDNPKPIAYGVKPSETNYGGTEWGWVGEDTAASPQLYAALKLIGGGGAYVPVTVDIPLTTDGTSVIDTRPSTPSGAGRWVLISITLRVKSPITGGGYAAVRVGSTSGGSQIVIPQTVTGAIAAGGIVGGLALTSLGTDMSQVNGFEACYGAGQLVYATVAKSGTVATGVVTAYLVWQALA